MAYNFQNRTSQKLRRTPFLSIVIPAHNEADRIGRYISEIEKVSGKDFLHLEIIIVNDGSTDKTWDEIENLRKNKPNITCLHLNRNRGKGYAVKKGIEISSGQYVLMADADGSTPFEELSGLFPFMEFYDIAIGSRYLPGSSIEVPQPPIRRIVSLAANVIIRTLLLPGITDSRCGFKLLKRSAALLLCSKQTLSGWSFDTEWLAIAKTNNVRIAEVPVRWRDSGKSNVKITRDAIRSMLDIIRIRWNLFRNKYKTALFGDFPVEMRKSIAHARSAKERNINLQLERY